MNGSSNHKSRSLRLWTTAFAVLALVAAACGSSGERVGVTEGTSDKPYEGVTLTLGKAPHGEDEAANMEIWLAGFEAETGINVEHTVIPWDNLEATYTASFAGSDPYDVTYQTSTHL
ncbi:MAG: hypothetical protein HOJ45_19425, partial [Gemmatimonadetes bacterium]|nr:hypothetical protein [Gemmatimonadota bacterium]